MRKLFYITLSLIILCGCSQKIGEGSVSDLNYSFTDSSGRAVTITEKPETVAILFSSYADIWLSAGGEIDVTVGETVERGFADTSSILVDEGSGHTTINLELLIASKPDLIIGTSDYECQRDTVKFTFEQGIPSAEFKVETFNDYLSVLKIFCDITERPDLYEKNGLEVKDRIEKIMTDSKASAEGKKILFIRAGSSARSTKAKNTEQHFVCGMLKELGTENVADSAEILLDGLSLETIVESQPDHIFISLMGNAESSTAYMESLLQSPGWKDLDCVKNGNYTFLPKELFHYKPNSRWDEAYSYLIEVLNTEN